MSSNQKSDNCTEIRTRGLGILAHILATSLANKRTPDSSVAPDLTVDKDQRDPDTTEAIDEDDDVS
ncbi:hypothetical protein ACFLWR_00200 [Chloroflexota bacterium]